MAKANKIKPKMIKTLLKSVREYKLPSILSPIFISLEVVMEVLIPTFMAILIDEGINKGSIQNVSTND